MRGERARAGAQSVAIVITGRGETSIAFLFPGGRSAYFDPHGAPSLGVRGSYWLDFISDAKLQGFFREKFYVDPSLAQVRAHGLGLPSLPVRTPSLY